MELEKKGEDQLVGLREHREKDNRNVLHKVEGQMPIGLVESVVGTVL